MSDVRDRPASEVKKFSRWLEKNGAVIEAPMSEWEVLRIRTNTGLHVIHQNKTGRQKWPAEAARLYGAMLGGMKERLSPDQKPRSKLHGRKGAIAERDGLECWFCAQGFLSVESREVTVEHLLAIAHGGGHHISNLVLACEPCNQEAGHLSIAEKVRIRERKRAWSAGEATSQRSGS